jgi:hypothetical protein
METIASISTIVASIVAVLAFLTGAFQFSRSQALVRANLKLQSDLLSHERETKAIELFIKFNELMQTIIEKPLDSSSHEIFWQHNAMLAVTESIHKLTNGDKEWDNTVIWMLRKQGQFLTLHPIDGSTYTASFLALIQSTIEDVCIESERLTENN